MYVGSSVEYSVTTYGVGKGVQEGGDMCTYD